MSGRRKGTSRSKRSKTAPSHCEFVEDGRVCGYMKVIQLHRIIPGRDKGKYVLGNVIALCPNHHAEADDEMPGAGRDDLREMIRERVQRQRESDT